MFLWYLEPRLGADGYDFIRDLYDILHKQIVWHWHCCDPGVTRVGTRLRVDKATAARVPAEFWRAIGCRD